MKRARFYSIAILGLMLISLFIVLKPRRMVVGMVSPFSDNVLSNSEDNIQITEVMFQPSTGEYEWVELQNSGTNTVTLNGYSLTDEDGNWYVFPHGLPAVPAGAFVVVMFDGVDAVNDDYDFSDNIAVLHSSLRDIFEDTTDQCALYDKGYFVYLPPIFKNASGSSVAGPTPFTPLPTSAVRDFVAWGDVPQEDARAAAIAGVWPDSRSVNLYRGLGDSSAEVALQANESIGLLPGSQL